MCTPSTSQSIARQSRRTRVMSGTPLSNISSIVLNDREQDQAGTNIIGSSSANAYTLPSSNLIRTPQRNRVIDVNSLGVNLMSKYGDLNHRKDNAIAGDNAKNHRASVSGENMTSSISRHPTRGGSTLIQKISGSHLVIQKSNPQPSMMKLKAYREVEPNFNRKFFMSSLHSGI